MTYGADVLLAHTPSRPVAVHPSPVLFVAQVNPDPELARMLASCWDGSPLNRPPAEYLSAKLDEMLQANTDSGGGGMMSNMFRFGRK